MIVLDHPPAVTYLRHIHPLVAQLIDATSEPCYCGAPLRTHVRCSGCTCLIGPGHAERFAIDGLCSSCYESARRRRRVC